jgi:hypothetical protein
MITSFTAADIERLRAAFASAEPFPHVVIDGFVGSGGEAALDAFPGGDWPHWRRFQDTYQREKRTCDDIRVIPEPLAALIRQANDAAFLETLETITGVSRLIPDPYLEGGGLHVSGPGGVLAPHTDFHLYERLDLYRALNLLIYLNRDWGEGDGGELELYALGEATPKVRVSPTFGRAVIFRTDDRSVHGFTTPVAPGKWRRSVALYYYTSRELAAFSGDTRTHWRARAIPMSGARLAAHDGLILMSRVLSKLAYMIDPNMRGQGAREP